jgi:hypothetical protein
MKIEQMLENEGLRNIEVFYVDALEAKTQRRDAKHYNVPDDEKQMQTVGWYYWFSLPGCLPDSSAFGPFRSESAAIRDAHNTFAQWD